MYYAAPKRPDFKALMTLSVEEKLAAFDTFGNVVVGEDDFTLAPEGGPYPIAFRSDDRGPDKIYEEGFRIREHGATKYPSSTGDVISGIGAAVIRLGKVDMDPKCSVSLAWDPFITALFPYDPKKLNKLFPRVSEVYICELNNYLNLYKIQEVFAPHLAFAQELATLDVPPIRILGHITIHCVLNSDRSVSLTLRNVFDKHGVPARLMLDLTTRRLDPITPPQQPVEHVQSNVKLLAATTMEMVTSMKGDPSKKAL